MGKNLNYRVEVRFKGEKGREGKWEKGLKVIGKGKWGGKNLITKGHSRR